MHVIDWKIRAILLQIFGMRDVINKGLTEEVILNGAGEAFEGGWTKVKLYFMLGLPTEIEEDMKEIAHLAEKGCPQIL